MQSWREMSVVGDPEEARRAAGEVRDDEVAPLAARGIRETDDIADDLEVGRPDGRARDLGGVEVALGAIEVQRDPRRIGRVDLQERRHVVVVPGLQRPGDEGLVGRQDGPSGRDVADPGRAPGW